MGKKEKYGSYLCKVGYLDVRQKIQMPTIRKMNNGEKQTFPGKVGFGGLDSLARGVVQESVDVLEETKLFNTSAELQNLIESLTKGNQDETQ